MTRHLRMNERNEIVDEIKMLLQGIEQEVDLVKENHILKEALEQTKLTNVYYEGGNYYNKRTKKHDPSYYQNFKQLQIKIIEDRDHELGLMEMRSDFLYTELIDIMDAPYLSNYMKSSEEVSLFESKFRRVQRQYNDLKTKIHRKKEKLKDLKFLLERKSKPSN